MRLTKMAMVIGIGALGLMTSPVQAGKCLSDYSHNLKQLAKHANRLTDKCWKEVQKGESNADKIIENCSGPEMERVFIMRQHKIENRALCKSSCRSELSAKQLCVDNRPLSYYLSKAN